MTKLEGDQRRRVHRPPRGIFVVGGVILAATLIIAGCGDDDDDQADPAGVLANYEDTRNSGDLDALMSLYADDAVVLDLPLQRPGRVLIRIGAFVRQELVVCRLMRRLVVDELRQHGADQAAALAMPTLPEVELT